MQYWGIKGNSGRGKNTSKYHDNWAPSSPLSCRSAYNWPFWNMCTLHRACRMLSFSACLYSPKPRSTDCWNVAALTMVAERSSVEDQRFLGLSRELKFVSYSKKLFCGARRKISLRMCFFLVDKIFLLLDYGLSIEGQIFATNWKRKTYGLRKQRNNYHSKLESNWFLREDFFSFYITLHKF